MMAMSVPEPSAHKSSSSKLSSGAGTHSSGSDKGSSSGSGGEGFVYNIVLDAGSTGSRIHVFKFSTGQQGSGALHLISDTFEQLKPGLSSYRDEPQKSAESLKPLMDIAVKAVPKAQQTSTGLSLKATAGLRLLPGSKADDILKVTGHGCLTEV